MYLKLPKAILLNQLALESLTSEFAVASTILKVYHPLERGVIEPVNWLSSTSFGIYKVNGHPLEDVTIIHSVNIQ